MEDLFEIYETLPFEVQGIILKYADGLDYDQCQQMQKELNKLGYDFDYGLDAIPYDLKLIINQ